MYESSPSSLHVSPESHLAGVDEQVPHDAAAECQEGSVVITVSGVTKAISH